MRIAEVLLSELVGPQTMQIYPQYTALARLQMVCTRIYVVWKYLKGKIYLDRNQVDLSSNLDFYELHMD